MSNLTDGLSYQDIKKEAGRLGIPFIGVRLETLRAKVEQALRAEKGEGDEVPVKTEKVKAVKAEKPAKEAKPAKVVPIKAEKVEKARKQTKEAQIIAKNATIEDVLKMGLSKRGTATILKVKFGLEPKEIAEKMGDENVAYYSKNAWVIEHPVWKTQVQKYVDMIQ